MANRNIGQMITPALRARVITPSNNELNPAVRMITVGTQGVLVFMDADGQTFTTGILPPGNYPVFAVRVLPATTAGNLTGWT